jgi:hypothetical protein
MLDPLFDATRLPAYYSETAACFERASGLVGRRVLKYRIGSLPFCLEFAGPALEPYMLPAFGHLAATEEIADFRVLLWDAKSTDVPMPPPPWPWGAFVRNEVYVGDRFKVVYNGDSGSLIMYDAAARQAIFWIREAENVPYYETGAPLLPAMHWWLESRNRQLVHAGAVATTDGGILLAGRGGSGKSTTALACLMDGFEFASDDYCVLETSNPVRVHSIYCSAKLAADSRNRLPGVAGAIHRPGASAEKALYLMNRPSAGRIAESFDLRAILLPRVAGTRETTVKPISPALALRALAPSTMFQLAGAGSRVFHVLASIIRRVPCFEISVGHDLARIPVAIRALLRNEALIGSRPDA